jgi:hypothetical protein
MKAIAAHDAKNRFCEFLNNPFAIIKSDRPVGIMMSIEDAADTLISELFIDREATYDD